MPSTFDGIHIALSALRAQQRALEVAAHNVANANTPGFSRQQPILEPARPALAPVPGASWGTYLGRGVQLAEVRRVRDLFLDAQVRSDMQLLGRWEARRDALAKVESIFNEPSDAGLRTVLDEFWASWQELANNPESLAARALVRQKGQALADVFRHLYRQLWDLQADLDRSIAIKVDDLNDLARQVAGLNEQIALASANRQVPNDLLDRRDLLVEQMARLADLQVQVDDQGVATVAIAGMVLVDRFRVGRMEVRPQPGSPNQGRVVWADTGLDVDPGGGELGGYLEARDQIAPGLMADLDRLATSLRDEVNRIHREGYGLLLPGEAVPPQPPGYNFFDPGATAANMGLAYEIRQDVRKIAASRYGAPGDGENALRIAGLQREKVVDQGTIDDFFRSVIGAVGVMSREAVRLSENQGVLLQQIDHQRQSVMGVSLDEEVTNLVRYQHAYAAAARVITTLDEMLRTLIEGTGLAGR
ncbi:MAG: flagellar hook-associated protein FlgK [Bacillota bacterium]|nr:flagellar hook-associated protein FlgK [Bacillota bacterium]